MIVQTFGKVREPVVNWGAAMNHAKRMLKAGYSMGEVVGCIRWLDKDEWAKDKSWSLAFVARKMPDYRTMKKQQADQADSTRHQIGDVKL